MLFVGIKTFILRVTDIPVDKYIRIYALSTLFFVDETYVAG